MTNKELQERLAQYPDDAEIDIELWYPGTNGYGLAGPDEVIYPDAEDFKLTLAHGQLTISNEDKQ